MKKYIILLTALTLVACSQEELDTQINEKTEQVESLEKELHKVEVENKQLKDDFKNIEEEIARINRDKKDDNIVHYQNVVQSYTASIENEIDRLADEINRYNKNKKLDPDAVALIENNIYAIVDNYNDSVDELKLQDSLTRQHNKIEVFNSNLEKEVEALKDAASKEDDKKIKQSIKKIKELNNYL